jgi:hypothetical protein
MRGEFDTFQLSPPESALRFRRKLQTRFVEEFFNEPIISF